MKKIPIILFLLIYVLNVKAQVSPSEKATDSLIDAFFFNEDEIIDNLIASLKKSQAIYISLNYSNKTYFEGRDVGIDQYNFTPQISYMHSKGFYASISGVYYDKLNPKWDVTTTSVGLNKKFGKQKIWNYNIAFSHYFYNSSVQNLYNNTVSIGFGIENLKKTVGSQLSASYLFGNENASQITSQTYFLLNLFKKEQISVGFRPKLYVVAGQYPIELIRFRLINGEIIRQIEKINQFSLINTQIAIPLQFNLNSFDVELGYTINLPSPIKGESSIKSTDFFNISLAYLIGI